MEETKKPIKGKLIYQPQGPAGEYAKWAINLYNGCSNGCTYCYNRRGVLSHAFGDEPKLAAPIANLRDKLLNAYMKREGIPMYQFIPISIKTASTLLAMSEIIEKDVRKIGSERIIQDGGIFLSFKSDPMAEDTVFYTINCIENLVTNYHVPVTVLTKDTAWLDDEKSEIYSQCFRLRCNLITFGFTITGMDELEPNAPSTNDRINALERVKALGYKTFVSMEPVVKFYRAKDVLMDIMGVADEIRLGLRSPFKKDRYEPDELIEFLQYLVAASRATPETQVILKKSFFDERLYKQIPPQLYDDYMELVNELKCSEPLD